MALTDDVASGDQRKALEALRDHLAGALGERRPGSVAALAKQLRDTLARLDALEKPPERSAVDDIAAARRARLARQQNGAS